MYLFKLKLSSFLDIFLGVGLLDDMIILFLFLKNLNTLFHSGYTNLHSHQCKRVPFVSTPSVTLIICRFLMAAILTRMKWYLVVVLISISPIISNVEHLFMCLLAICISYLDKCLFRYFAHSLIELFVFLVLSYMSCLYIWKLILCQLFHLLLFSPTLRVFFSHCL